ncbi:MAG: hypothetical protein MZV49_07365 [Rhodopseudomonas palustris]|nr:hypothetical protein [Rhodopseudomonas palustris]
MLPSDAHGEKDLGKTLADNDHVIAFAYGTDAFPPTFRLAADGILALPSADLSALKTASQAVSEFVATA